MNIVGKYGKNIDSLFPNWFDILRLISVSKYEAFRLSVLSSKSLCLGQSLVTVDTKVENPSMSFWMKSIHFHSRASWFSSSFISVSCCSRRAFCWVISVFLLFYIVSFSWIYINTCVMLSHKYIVFKWRIFKFLVWGGLVVFNVSNLAFLVLFTFS